MLLASATSSFTVTLAGDMDGDGYVGPTDLSLFASAYGKGEGQLGYDPLADLDKDAYIGPIDLSVFAANYAQPHKTVDFTCQLLGTNKTFTVTVEINLADGMDQNEAIEVATNVFEKEFEASIGYIAYKPTSANVDEKGIWTVEFSWGYKNEGLGHWFRAVINPFDQTILYDRCK